MPSRRAGDGKRHDPVAPCWPDVERDYGKVAADQAEIVGAIIRDHRGIDKSTGSTSGFLTGRLAVEAAVSLDATGGTR